MAKATHLTMAGATNPKLQRFWEIVPGVCSWLFLLSPILLSFSQPVLLAYLIIAYDLLWFTKAFGLSTRLLRGYGRLRAYQKINWQARLTDLDNIPQTISRLEGRLQRNRLRPATKKRLVEYKALLEELQAEQVEIMNPKDIYHAVIVATYNESLAILEPTIKALTNSHYDLEKIWLFIAYEERGGEQTAANARYLVKTYGHYFGAMKAVKHPQNLPGEVRGKGGNITYTGRRLESFIKKQKVDSAQVIVTTLDSDNRPMPDYFSYLSFVYATTPDRKHKSYQPLAMYYNNIWEVPAPMRIIATGNSFWLLMETMRPHRLRNFSAHAQSLDALIETDYWSTETVVEDGHQFWRSYFTFDGNYEVIPLYTPIFQDAVLAKGYWRTFRAQFVQLRRWAYGASDIPYVFINSLRNKRIPWYDKSIHFIRLFEGHFTWATAALILALAAWAPLILNPGFNDQVLAHQLPQIASRIQTVAMIGLVITILVSLISLPPRPAHYKRHRSLWMVAQWVLLPITTIAFSSLAALNAQTRLIFGRYLEQFDVTEKATREDNLQRSDTQKRRFERPRFGKSKSSMQTDRKDS